MDYSTHSHALGIPACRSYKQVSRPMWDDDSRIRSVRLLHLLLHCRASVGA